MAIALYFLAFMAGAAVSTQAVINSQLAAGLAGNTLAAALISFCVGTATLAIIAVARGSLTTTLAALPAQPLWNFSGGVLGAGFLFSAAFLAPRIGLTNMLVLMIAGQLLMSVAIDHFGLLQLLRRPVSPIRLLGAGILLLGVFLTLFGDRLWPFKVASP